MAIEVAPVSRIKPEHRIALYYFTTMMPLGAIVVYAGIWFASKGISSEGIGIINAMPMLVILTLNLTIGRLADRASDWRGVIVAGATMHAFVALGLFFVDEFWGVLAVWTLMLVPNSVVSPVSDAATMRLTKRNGTSFGPIRAGGTIGYMLAVGVTGFLVDHFGGQIFVPLFVALAFFKAAAAQALPPFRAPADRVVAARPKVTARLREVLRPWFVLPLVGYALAFSTHLILNAFAALLWKAQGISESAIGPLIVLGAIAEAAMMYAWKWVPLRFSARTTMIASALIGMARWTAMGLSPPLEVLIFLQLLHAFTFALGYLSCVDFIARHTREEIAAEAQSFYVVIQTSVTIAAVTGFGWLIGPLGPHAYFVAAVVAAIGALLIWRAPAKPTH